MPTIKLPYPHPGQRYVREHARRFSWLSAGRRWRKTTLAMSIAVEAAITGGTYIWGAPTFDQVRIGFAECKHALGTYADFNQSRMTADLPRGGRVVYRSLDNPDNARGFTADGVVMDEAAFCKQAAWQEVLRPMLIDTGGWLWAIFTPNGRNWTYAEWHNAADRDDSIAWQVPTLGVKIGDSGQLVRDPHPLENPDIEFSEIEQLWRTMPERVFRQEILAEFMESGGGVFRRVMEAATATEQSGAIEGHQYVIGVDLAKHNDFTVFSVVDVTGNEQVYIDRDNKVDLTVQLGRLKALNNRFRPVTNIIEVNFNEMFAEQARRDGLPVHEFRTTNATKQKAIDDLAYAFENGALKILNEPVQIGELQAFEISKTPSGMVKYSAPDGLHDDTVIALALAWQGATVPPPAGQIVMPDMAIYKSKRRTIWDSGIEY